jgi:hypothetical protein
MKITQCLGIGLLLAGVCGLSARADVYMGSGQTGTGVATIKSADDAVASIPILSKLSRAFLIGDGYKLKLTGKELRIDHMGDDSRLPVSHRNCMISLNYDAPVAFFGSSLEIPLISAAGLNSQWNTSSLGDYVAHFSKDSTVDHAVVGLKLTARF